MPVAARVAIVLLIALAVWKLPGGGRAAAAVWETLGATMLAAIAWTAWRFGKEHWLDLDRMGERGRAVLYGAIALVALAMAGRVTMWASVGGSLVWLTMVVAAAAGAFRSWQLWRSL